MAKKAMIEREKKRQKLVEQYAARRAALKEIANDESKPSSSTGPSQPLPKEFGRYRILKVLGEGAMGSVYLGRDPKISQML